MTNVPAGWYRDPGEASRLRYWDGDEWTEHYRPVAPTRLVQSKPQLGDSNLPTLWQAWGKPLSGIGGGKYRLTAHYLYFERGTLRTDSQQVPVAALQDIDVRQSMPQKARGVGTIIVHINRGPRTEVVQLADVPNFREGQHAINDAATKARLAIQRQQNTSTVRYEGVHPAKPAASSIAPTAAGDRTGSDDFEQLERLAKLRDNGILSEDEFAAKKAEILRRM